MDTMQKLELVKDFVEEAVDRGATSVEKIHRTIAELPFEAVERIAALPAPLLKLREAQRGAITVVYNAIRQVNREIGGLLSEQFATAEASREAAEAMPRPPARKGRSRRSP